VPRPNIPPPENPFLPCNDCDLKAMPASIKKTEEIIYSYPGDGVKKCDCENCEGSDCDDCDC
jgi:hypothetical protein